MAKGDVRWFGQALLDLGNKIHDLDGDTYNVALVSAATVPAVGTAAPHFGGTGTTNFATNQVSTGGTSYTGPVALTSVTWSLVSGVPTFRAAIVQWLLDAAGPTNCSFAIIYNNTDANKRAIGFVDLRETSGGAAQSLAAAPIVLDWSGATNDIFTITQSA
jgi:hypothetical protein